MTRIWGFGGFDLCPDQCVQLGKGSEDSYHELMKAMALTVVLDAGHEPMSPLTGEVDTNLAMLACIDG